MDSNGHSNDAGFLPCRLYQFDHNGFIQCANSSAHRRIKSIE